MVKIWSKRRRRALQRFAVDFYLVLNRNMFVSILKYFHNVLSIKTITEVYLINKQIDSKQPMSLFSNFNFNSTVNKIIEWYCWLQTHFGIFRF